MTDQEILELDPKFDFDNVYKRNFCTLFNIFIHEVKLNYKISIDGEEKDLAPKETLLCAYHRQWCGERLLPIDETTFFTEKEKMREWLDEKIIKMRLEKITKEEAVIYARDSHEFYENLRKKIKLLKNKGK
jgi:predicted Holliday junction resolvase-like endonuclease